MPASLSDLINEKARISVLVDPRNPESDRFDITYRVGAVTDEAVERAVEDGTEWGTGNTGQTVSLALSWIVSWDLKWNESDTDYVPLTRESVRKIPTAMLESWVMAIVKDQQPDPKAKKTSHGR